MIPFVADHIQELRRLSEEYRVQRLELFGSAVTGEFGNDSDLDFLVEWENRDSVDIHIYFELWTKIEKLYGRDVDLFEVDSVNLEDNKYLKKSIDKTKITVYERLDNLGVGGY